MTAVVACLRSLWRPHRNDPGWLVGEHMQDRRVLPPAGDEEEGDATLTDLAGERVAPPEASLTRVGDAVR